MAKVTVKNITKKAIQFLRGNLVDPFDQITGNDGTEMNISSAGGKFFAYLNIKVKSENTLTVFQSLGYYSEAQNVPAVEVIAKARALAKYFPTIDLYDDVGHVNGDLQKVLDHIGDRETINFGGEGMDGSNIENLSYSNPIPMDKTVDGYATGVANTVLRLMKETAKTISAIE